MDGIALQTIRDEVFKKLVVLLKYARQVTEALPGLVDNFVRQVAEEQGLSDLPPGCMPLRHSGS